MSEAPNYPTTHDPQLLRYARQMQFPPLGAQGQAKLQASRVLVCGCGALGSMIAESLVRSGVGHVRIVDRDFLETNNLQRQVLYDESDVASGYPKAIVAQRKLQQINSQITIEGIVADVDHRNIGSLIEGVEAIVDGTDNFEIRFLLNDAALRYNIPWIYGGCIGSEGQTMTIVPGDTPCLRCLMRECPPPGTTPTCDTAGILAPIAHIVASLQAAEALKILSGHREAINRHLTVIDIWDNRMRQVNLSGLRTAADCPACDRHEYEWLAGQRGSVSAVLCGRQSVQLSFPDRPPVPLDELAERLSSVGALSGNAYLLRLDVPDHRFTFFADGRAIVSGTSDVAQARSLYARYVGL